MIGANLILGGVDFTGNHLYTIGPFGSMDKRPYLAMGKHEHLPYRNVHHIAPLLNRPMLFFRIWGFSCFGYTGGQI